MRSGQYIHALGRRSFEPSQPATSDDAELPLPSEQSQERQRQLVKAQNDVLATVGVCLRETKSSLENRESRRLENDVGILISALDMVAAYVVSWPLVGVRNRLQVSPMSKDLRWGGEGRYDGERRHELMLGTRRLGQLRICGTAMLSGWRGERRQ